MCYNIISSLVVIFWIRQSFLRTIDKYLHEVLPLNSNLQGLILYVCVWVMPHNPRALVWFESSPLMVFFNWQIGHTVSNVFLRETASLCNVNWILFRYSWSFDQSRRHSWHLKIILSSLRERWRLEAWMSVNIRHCILNLQVWTRWLLGDLRAILIFFLELVKWYINWRILSQKILPLLIIVYLEWILNILLNALIVYSLGCNSLGRVLSRFNHIAFITNRQCLKFLLW